MTSKLQMSKIERAPLEKMPQWFKNALSERASLPSAEVCDELARKFQIIVNRADNAEKRRGATVSGTVPPSFFELRDDDVNITLNGKLDAVAAAGKPLLFQLEELESFAGNYHWVQEGSSLNVEDLRGILSRIGAFVPADSKRVAMVKRGQPPKIWHVAVARAFAPLVVRVLRDLGFEKADLDPMASASATAQICAKAMAWAYKDNITPEAFADAIRKRDRSRKGKGNAGFFDPSKPLEERFPDMTRVDILGGLNPTNKPLS
jgi:hypothetical protein